MSRVRDLASILTASSSIATDTEVSAVSAQIPGFVAGKNKIINGDFAIWQRGITFSNPGGVYTADRWDLSYDGSGTTRTVSRQAFTPGAAPVAGYEGQFFYRYARSGGTGGTVDYLLRQRVEDVRTLAGQTVTVSFWAKADSARSMGLDFFQIFGTGGSSSVYVGVGTYNLTTSWQRFTTTVSIPGVSGKTINNSDSALLLSYYIVSTNATWTVDIWGVQLESGSVATPFTTASGSIGGELSLCQRYYQTSFPTGTAPANNIAPGMIFVQIPSNGMSNGVLFQVPMRAAPSITTFNPYANNSNWRIAFSATDVTPSISTQGNVGIYTATTTGSSATVAQAVHGNWAASAEF